MPARHVRGEDKKYHINGKVYDELEGSRAKVMHHTAYRTSGGLKRKDLMYNKNRSIVSVRKHKTAKKEKRLMKHGYTAKKGKFGAVKIASHKKHHKKSHKKSHKKRSHKK
tara:strand:- start:215 stop:544 length:330 start_codon:yes stop_codon:yes gene_type:complete